MPSQRDTLASTQTQLSKSVEIRRGTYYKSGACLYYIADVKVDSLGFLVENCYTNESKWITTSEFTRIKKEVIRLDA